MLKMKTVIPFFVILCVSFFPIMAQQTDSDTSPLPYEEIPAYPDEYSAGNIIGRMIDGLGYRYYWATKDLRSEDLKYKPSEDGRSMEETITHLYGLSLTIVNAPQSIPNIRPADWSNLTFEEKRALTLKNFQKASELTKASRQEDIDNFKTIFQSGDRKSEFPFWNMLNGPIADAIYHTGQVVLMRRASGNPMHPGVSVLIGKTRQ